MKTFICLFTLAIIVCGAGGIAYSYDKKVLSKAGLSNPEKRNQAVRVLAEEGRAAKAVAEQKAQKLGWQIKGETEGVGFELMALRDGRPAYYITQNVNAAISTAADLIRNTPPYNLNGNGFTVGIWDAGSVLSTHQEFGTRVSVMDGAGSHWHSTHVGGTIAASGVNAAAMGMSPNVEIDSYDWDLSDSEMAGRGASYPQEPGTIYLSNHSYGIATGWLIGSYSGNYAYHWFGNLPDREADGFGQYSDLTETWDSICYAAPYYLPFKAAGNDRGDYAPSNGATFYYLDSGGAWQSKSYNSSTDPYDDGWDNGGFDTIPHEGCAKNIMTIGAVSDAVHLGSRSLSDARMTSFGSWGPTDDGRIKPDVVANGTGLYSCIDSSNSSYESYSGTSMSTPNASGSAALLIQLYGRLFPSQAMRASTLKALIIHTADDLGNPGPDYSFGWGLMNVKCAADLIIDHNQFPSAGKIFEGAIDGGNPDDSFTFTWNGDTAIRATLCWTDPPANALFGLDNPFPRLINDLDLRITGPNGITVYYPYVLDPLHPADIAVTSDNTRDNIEQVYIPSPNSPGIYTVQISHKGTLTDGQQQYSLIVTGQYHNPSSRGTVNLDRETYSCADSVKIELCDGDLISNGTQDVQLSTSGADVETVTLFEDNFRGGIFSNSIETSSVAGIPQDGILQVSDGQTITVVYQDINDGNGTSAAPADSAAVDCQAPIIQNMEISEITSSAVTIFFETNEPTTAAVSYGLQCQDLNNLIEDPVISTEHTLYIAYLVPDTNYYFSITARDQVNNVAVDTNSGLCHQFVTIAEPCGIHVPADYPTIQAAINSAVEGNIIIVADGTYIGTGNRDIDFLGKKITVTSENGPVNCIIDCQGSSSYPHRGFNFHSGEVNDSIVSGFTIKNGFGPQAQLLSHVMGYGNYSAGGAIFCKQASPTIENCVFKDNETEDYSRGGAIACSFSNSLISGCSFENNAAFYGGAVYAEKNFPVITDCKFTGNSAIEGGAIETWEAAAQIRNNVVSDNFSTGYGGGMYCYYGGVTITNCIVSNNTAFDGGLGVGMGGGIRLELNPGNISTVTNCTVVGNSAEEGGGGIGWGVTGSVNVTNCIVRGNSSPQINAFVGIVTYNNIEGGFPGQGNIDADPCFVSSTDYHLGAGSSCIDAGTNSLLTGFPPTDFDGKPRPLDGDANQTAITDIGACEYWAGPALSFIALDRTQLSFSAAQPPVPQQKSFNLRNGWARTLNWQITEDCPWLEVVPACGSSTGEVDEVNVIVNPAGLPQGTYSYTLSISDPNAANNPQTILVQLRVGILQVPSDYPTIQAAVDAAFDGEEIVVADGTYTGPGNRDITCQGKHLTIAGENGPQNCVIDCQNTGRGFYINGTPASGTIIRGFTIINGLSGKGSGIYCENSSPVIEDCRIVNCSAVGEISDGGGLYFYYYCNPLIKSCVISGNTGYRGGGIFAYQYCNSQIVNCLIINNLATDSSGGGGIACRSNSSIDAANCTFANNTALSGGAIRAITLYDSVTVVNCIFWDDFPNEISVPGTSTVTYSNIEGGYPGVGNINQNPLFVSPGDYHLIFGSPCVDTGTNSPPNGLPENDLDGYARPFDGDFNNSSIADMGAYELHHDPNSPVLAASPLSVIVDSLDPDPDYLTPTLSIWNVGAGLLNWQITEDCNWLEVSPSSGQSSGEVDEVTLTVNPQGLSFGEHICFLTVFDPYDASNTMSIQVTLRLHQVINVPADFPAIQTAIDSAFNGCEIIVADGIYTGQGNRDIDFKGKAVTVKSQNGPQNCVIDCQGSPADSHRGFYFHSNEGPNSVLNGFTITNGYYTEGAFPQGGAILCLNPDTNPSIRYCIIKQNTASGGGGIALYSSNLNVTNCIIFNNNALSDKGGAILIGQQCNAGIYNCTISQNNAQAAGDGIYFYDGSLEIENSIVWANGTEEIYQEYGSVTVSYSDVKGGYSGTGNINSNPLFVNQSIGDFHILPNSPCIESGNPNYVAQPGETDIDGKSRVVHHLDMGADEVEQNPADFTQNGKVNYEDLDIFADAWLSQTGSVNWNEICDLNDDGLITLKDFAEFAREWRWQASWY